MAATRVDRLGRVPDELALRGRHRERGPEPTGAISRSVVRGIAADLGVGFDELEWGSTGTTRWTWASWSPPNRYRGTVFRSVVVVVSLVTGVSMSVVDVVDVIAVGDRDVPAAFAVNVGVVVVRGVLGRFALVVVSVVLAVQMSVVYVVGVVLMRDGYVPATLAVCVVVTRVRVVCRCGHASSSFLYSPVVTVSISPSPNYVRTCSAGCADRLPDFLERRRVRLECHQPVQMLFALADFAVIRGR